MTDAQEITLAHWLLIMSYRLSVDTTQRTPSESLASRLLRFARHGQLPFERCCHSDIYQTDGAIICRLAIAALRINIIAPMENARRR